MNVDVALSHITLISAAPFLLARFYETALGFSQTGSRIVVDPALSELLGIPAATAQVVTLRLGDEQIELMRIDPPGHSYPGDVPGASGLFQHFAIEVPDMGPAMTRLQAASDWTPISTDGPEILPPASGGVTAYKYRDPEGHPLELITATQRGRGAAARPPRIGHSAISVACTVRSLAFYESLGLKRMADSLNAGPEQARLDNIPKARVAVTALSVPRAPVPHLELLCYGSLFVPAAPDSLPNDIAATQLVFTVHSDEDLIRLLRRICPNRAPVRFADGGLKSLMRDPDGHRLCLEVSPRAPSRR